MYLNKQNKYGEQEKALETRAVKMAESYLRIEIIFYVTGQK